MYKVFKVDNQPEAFCVICTRKGYEPIWAPTRFSINSSTCMLKVHTSMLMGGTHLLYVSKSRAKAISFARMHNLIGV